MNISIITAKVAEFVDGAKDVRCNGPLRGVWECLATVDGKTKAVPFEPAGLYGVPRYGLYADAPKSELWLAAQIAKEMRG